MNITSTSIHCEYHREYSTASTRGRRGGARGRHKVVERLLGIWDSSILRSTHRPRPSSVQKAIAQAGELANLVAQMEEIGLFEVVYTDFTEILYADGDRKAILMPIIGHVSKMAFGWAVGERRGAALALQAWEHAKRTFQQMGISYVGMIVHHDRDSVYTGYEWTSQLLLKGRSWLSYALRGAKDNPEPATPATRVLSQWSPATPATSTRSGVLAVVLAVDGVLQRAFQRRGTLAVPGSPESR